jgi:hypothetical protein
MGEDSDDAAAEFTAQIVDFLKRWPSKYPSPAKIALATGRTPKEVIDELARMRSSGEMPVPPETFDPPPERPPVHHDEQPVINVEPSVVRDGSVVPPPVLPAWDRSN